MDSLHENRFGRGDVAELIHGEMLTHKNNRWESKRNSPPHEHLGDQKKRGCECRPRAERLVSPGALDVGV